MVICCDVCSLPIPYSVCFFLKPCYHAMCVRCFHEAVPASYALKCPCNDCHKWVTSSVLVELSHTSPVLQTTAKATDTIMRPRKTSMDGAHQDSVIEIQEVTHFEPDEQMDPFRHWAVKKPQLYTGFIYVSYRVKDDEATFYKANFKALNSTVFMDDSSSDELVKIFARILHPLMFRKNFMGGNVKYSRPRTTASATKKSDFDKANILTSMYVIPCAKIQRDQYLAVRCLYALSSGRFLTREQRKEIGEGDHVNLERKARACAKFLSRELMRTYEKASTARKNLMEKFHNSSSSTAELSFPIGRNDDGSIAESDDSFPTIVLFFFILSAVLMIAD
jgi:hypothetical protein